MSVEFKPRKSLAANLRRLPRKLLMDAQSQLSQTHRSRDATVHDLRKLFKKIRALLRLFRIGLGEEIYREENRRFRDLGRPLTAVRDAKVLVETFDKLLDHFHDHIASNTFDSVRESLQSHHRLVRKQVLGDRKALSKVKAAVDDARSRSKRWPMPSNRWRVVGAGVEAIFRSARKAYFKAASETNTETLHEWREQTKYLRYQLTFLAPLWRQRMEELASEADELGELLGEDHDLVVLRLLLSEADSQVSADQRETLTALIDRRQAELRLNAFALGERFFRDRPKDFARRVKGYWRTSRAEPAHGNTE
jgi:CHAD domain-containing protein